jgi:hypothetical protein
MMWSEEKVLFSKIYLTDFTIILYIFILTALLMALDLNIFLRLQNRLLLAAVFDFISRLITFYEFIKAPECLKF